MNLCSTHTLTHTHARNNINSTSIRRALCRYSLHPSLLFRLVSSVLWWHGTDSICCARFHVMFFMSFRVCTHPRFMWKCVRILFARHLLQTPTTSWMVLLLRYLFFMFFVFLEILIELKLIDLTRRRRFKVSHLQYGRRSWV